MSAENIQSMAAHEARKPDPEGTNSRISSLVSSMCMGSVALAPAQRTASARGSSNAASPSDRLSYSSPASEDLSRSAEGCKQRPPDGRTKRDEATRKGELVRVHPDDERWWRSTAQDDVLAAFNRDNTSGRVSMMTPSGTFNATFRQGGGGIGAGAASATGGGDTPTRGATETVNTLRETNLEKRLRETPCASPLPSPSRDGYLGDHRDVPQQPCQHRPPNEVDEVGGAVPSHPSSSLLAEHGSEEAGVGVGVGAGILERDEKGFAVGTRREDILRGNHHDKGGVSTRGETLWSRRRRQKEAEEAAARKEAVRAKKMRAEMVLEVLYIPGTP